MNSIIDKLELLNPLNSLKRGFSVTYKDNKLVSDINKINISDIIKIRLNNGSIMARVTNKNMEVENVKRD